MVFGPVVHPVPNIASLNESNAVLWGVADGVDPLPSVRVPIWIDVRDLAEAHVQALLRPEAGGKRFIPVSPEKFSYEYAADIMKEKFGWAKSSITGNFVGGEKPPPSYGADGETVARELGVQYRSFEETVVDFVGQVKESISQ